MAEIWHPRIVAATGHMARALPRSTANAGFIFVVLQRVAHALGVGEGCAVTASYPEVRSDHQHANPFRTAPSLCADMIFGKDSVDHVVVLGEAHLRRILTKYAGYYNELRTHRSLD